jgi:tRNA(Ile)-lysidine synthase
LWREFGKTLDFSTIICYNKKMNPKEIQRKVFAFIREYHMLVPGESVLAGVSGGADSVCLLFLLLEWRRRFGGQLGVIHVNHGLRPEAAKEAAFVEKLCAEQSVDFFLKEEDVGVVAHALHLGTEEAGRLIRYRAFQELSAAWGHCKVAVAHNANDLAETMLFHLFRGSGIRGLSGIPPVRDHLIRPILCLERWEVETYLEALGQPYCTDSSNASDDYTRNRIRRHILPYAKKTVSSQVIIHMSQAATILRETEDYLEHQTGEAAKTCVSYRGNYPVIEVDSFCGLDPMLQKRLLYQLLRDLVPERKDISQVHVADLLNLFLKEGNRTVYLPKGIRGRRSYQEVLLFQDSGDPAESFTPIRIAPKDMSQEVMQLPLPEGGILKYRRIPFQKIEKIPRNQYTKWFDCDKIKGYLELRTRCSGDYFYIKGSAIEKEPTQYQKSIKKFMTDMKIPAADRNNLPLLAEGQHILWVIGYRISESYKVDEDTKWILEVSVDVNENRKFIQNG